MKESVSVDVLRGISLALWAAQEGHSRVVISNKALQEWLGQKKVHTARIEELAEKLERIFRRHRIKPDRNTKGHMLTLYLNQKKTQNFIPIIDGVSRIEFIRNKLKL